MTDVKADEPFRILTDLVPLPSTASTDVGLVTSNEVTFIRRFREDAGVFSSNDGAMSVAEMHGYVCDCDARCLFAVV